MANEYLTRTPTSTGNRKVWTLALWLKRNIVAGDTGADVIFNAANTAANSHGTDIRFRKDNTGSTGWNFYDYNANAFTWGHYGSVERRDSGNWFHAMFVFDSTKSTSSDRVRVYINGILDNNYQSSPGIDPSKNYETYVNSITAHYLGVDQFAGSLTISYSKSQFADVFLVDGQALTPDVFGFYKQGKGYISAGSTQATDFRPGQWVPKTPRVIKTEINRRGGFGVNGFYLPMNDSSNFGADFHCDPNSIITLNEKLPQPRVGVASTASVGLGYTDALRADPYAANLVLALPFVSDGLNSGFGDYAPSIKGSGTAKTFTNTNVSIGNTGVYYGSASNFTSSSSSYLTSPRNVTDYNMGSGDFTVEGWVYFKSINSGQYTRFFSIGYSNNEGIVWELNITTSTLTFTATIGTPADYNAITTPFSIVANQWYHFAQVRKGTTHSAYVNGVCVGIDTTTNGNINFDSNTAVVIGAWENPVGSYGRYTDAYLQDLRIYKGVAKYTGGFDVPKPYTPVGIATWRAVPDTTANNFAIMNSLYLFGNANTSWVSNITLSDGNLSASWTSGTGSNQHTRSSIAMLSGKWYFEGKLNSTSGGDFGIAFENHINDSVGYGSDQKGFSYRNDGQKQNSTSATAYGSSYGTSDIIGVAYDADAGEITFYKNGVSQGIAFSGISIDEPAYFGCGKASSSTTQTASFNFGQNPTFSGNTAAGTYTDSNGKGLFKYQPPSGFLALCEDNLPTPAISDPGKHFKTVLYTGDNNAGRNIVGVGFTPDLVWVKPRTTSGFNNLFDSVRGATNVLFTNETNVESSTNSLISFNSDGFSLGTAAINSSIQNNVAWCWRAGAGTTSTNTDGSITSVVSVNQDAGFSIVSYTGNGSNPTTVGHGLNRAPKFIIFKCRSAAVNWFVYHGFNSSGAFEGINTTNAFNSGLALFNQTAPTSSVINLGNEDSNINGRTYIAYCWAEIEGFSKFGSYVGNGSADGPFVYCGGKPAFVMIKRTDTTGEWAIIDSSRNSTNPTNFWLKANTNGLDDTGATLDFLSNGFKLRLTSNNFNASGGTYIFACWMESPFTTANAK